MKNEELKKKIEDILEEYNFKTDDGEGWALDTEEMADDLIAAGIGDVREAEHRAERAERALDLLAEYAHEFYTKTRFVGDYFVNDPKAIRRKFLKQAEKELEEERKDD